MTAPRFARYRPTEGDVNGRHAWAVPEGGLCLSAFLVLVHEEHPEFVLLGRPVPSASWNDRAALGPAHFTGLGDRWMLPASHLLEGEPPDRAAERIATELLGARDLTLDGPEVFTEIYPDPLGATSGIHWDVHFVYRGAWVRPSGDSPALWRALDFVDPRQLYATEVGRGHADILELTGFRFQPPRAPGSV